MDRIKVAKSIAAGGFMAGLLTSPSGSADDVEIKFGGYIKLDAAYTTNGVDGVQDSTGNYNLDLLSADEDAEVRIDVDELESIGRSALSVGLNHNWSDKLRSNILYSMAEADDQGINPHLFDEVSSLHINTFYQALPMLRFGFEYQIREADLTTGTDTELERLHFSTTMDS